MPNETSKVNTVVLCKNSMLREGLKHTLLGTRFHVCAHDLAQSFGDDGLDNESPALLVLDVNLHDQATAEFVQETKLKYPNMRVVVLADEFDMDCMLSVLRVGADGYCLSTVDCEVLVKYLDLAMLGETVFPSGMLLASLASRDMTPRVEKMPSEVPETLQAMAAGSPIRTLSSREAEILHCLMQGAPNKIIARRLEVAEATVKVHIKAILRKIRVTNRTQAAMWAVAHMPAANVDDARVASPR